MAYRLYFFHLPKRIYRAIRLSTEEDADVHAACISFYMFIWLLLIAVVMFATTRIVMRNYVSEEAVRTELHEWIAVQTTQNTADFALKFIEEGSIEDNTVLAAGIFGILIAGGTVFVCLERAFLRMWGIEYPKAESWLITVKHVMLDRLRAFAFLMLICLLAIAMFLTILFLKQYTIATQEALGVSLLKPTYYMASFVLNWFLVTLLFWLMPRTTVNIFHAARGALFCAIVWEIGRLPIEYLVTFGKISTYGVFGVLVAIMLWIFYATRVVLTGASYVRILGEEKSGESSD
ncbi:MAG: hypothetical protein COA78_26670 [Blastopirellula sp.]|nr:MAG: hypothetical protein COA78_26670 [Blastopirellula sp.]